MSGRIKILKTNAQIWIKILKTTRLDLDPPQRIRSDNGSELTVRVARGWFERLGVETPFIEPGSPWENGYCESFNGKLRDEVLNPEILYTLREA